MGEIMAIIHNIFSLSLSSLGRISYFYSNIIKVPYFYEYIYVSYFEIINTYIKLYMSMFQKRKNIENQKS